MKIVYCHNFYRIPGGEDQVYFDESRLMESRGHEILRYEKHNQTLDQTSQLTMAKNTFWNSTVYRELKEISQRFQPDIVHFTNTFPILSPAAYWSFRNSKTRVIQSLHNFRMICPGSLLLRNGKICEDCVGKTLAWKSVLHGCYRASRLATAISASSNLFHHALGTWKNRVDRYIALTEASKNFFLKSGLAPEKIVVKPNFVLSPPAANESKSDFAIFAGRFSHEKGIQVLLDAWRQLDSPPPLKIVGSGPLESEVIEAANQLKGKIDFLGQRPHDEVMKLMAQARLVIVPSIYVETFGRTVIEAYSVATPVIASDIGSLAENVTHGQTGYLFQPGNAEALAQTVNQFIADESQSVRFGQQALVAFHQKFSADQNYQALLKIYNDFD